MQWTPAVDAAVREHGRACWARYRLPHMAREDLVQELRLHVFRHLERFDDDRDWRPYVRTLCVNRAVSLLRAANAKKRRSQDADGLAIHDACWGPDETARWGDRAEPIVFDEGRMWACPEPAPDPERVVAEREAIASLESRINAREYEGLIDDLKKGANSTGDRVAFENAVHALEARVARITRQVRMAHERETSDAEPARRTPRGNPGLSRTG